jgi:hypothetical protein
MSESGRDYVEKTAAGAGATIGGVAAATLTAAATANVASAATATAAASSAAVAASPFAGTAFAPFVAAQASLVVHPATWAALLSTPIGQAVLGGMAVTLGAVAMYKGVQKILD